MYDSNISIKSNIYPRKGYLHEDKEFISKIRDKKFLKQLVEKASLGKLQINTLLSNSQKFILERDFEKCYYNKDGDYTWGIANVNGEEKLVCKCREIECKRFLECRPDISPEEIEEIKQENRFIELKKVAELRKKEKVENQLFLDIHLKRKDKQNKNNKNTKGTEVIKLPSMSTNVNIQKDYSSQKKEESKKTDISSIDLKEKKDKINKQTFDTDRDLQDVVIRAPIDKKILVNAGPGTGKTYTLVERLKYMIAKIKDVDPQEIMVLSFSRAAIKEIGNRVFENSDLEDSKYWDLNLIDIRTFDSFATYLITEVEPEYDLSEKNYDERIEIAINIIQKNPDIFSSIKHLIIDEIQDLVGIRAKLVQVILEHVNCGFTLFGDLCQSIFDYNAADERYNIDSEQFYEWIINKFNNGIDKYEFNVNYRQEKSLAEKSMIIRDHIINKDEKAQEKVLIETIDDFNYIGYSHNLLDKLPKDKSKTICFLCRTNGQVLKVSKYLRDQNIKNIINKPSTYKVIDKWVADIFTDFTSKYVSYEDFKLKVKEKNFFTKDSLKDKWELLKKIEGRNSSKLQISELARNLRYKKYYYEDICTKPNSNVIVSTIHRAKGREYDCVVLLDDNVLQYKNSNGIKNEVKIYYVGITRPRKEIFKTNFRSNVYMTYVGANKRWIETGYRSKKKKRITFVEIGKEEDIEIESFVDINIHGSTAKVIENQKYIRDNVKPSDPLEFKLNYDINGIRYDIYHFGKCIGRLSEKFSNELFYAFKKIQNHYTKDKRYMPDEIRDVYVDDVCTYVINIEKDTIPEHFLENGLWYGITVVGLGKIWWYSDN